MHDRVELQGDDPFALFHAWFDLAQRTEPNDPNAAALATSTPDGAPSVRMVLIKDVSAVEGFCFYTNVGSQKGRELAANPRAALCFHWKSLRRQVRVEGSVTHLPGDEVDRYFHSRSRPSQVGAAVSAQSRPLRSRAELEAEVASYASAHQDREIPRPEFWQGFAIQPHRIEFWMDGPNRLHDRILFSLDPTSSTWSRTRLYP